MQAQPFMFNPMQLECPRSAKQTNSRRDDVLKSDFLQNEKTNRNQRITSPNIRNDKEPLLLSSATNMKTHQEQGSKLMKSGERLTTLHSQLYQQTEKLKQWKMNTEMQMNDKDRKITEASKTIESLRKSILELQFLNESVSSRLHEEKTLQDETIQKITTTRNMCNALKEHLVKLENGVHKGENMLEKQRQDTEFRVNQYEELALRFQELEIKVTCKEHQLEKEAMKTKNEYKEKIEELEQTLNESKKQAASMKDTNQHYEAEIVEINQELKTTKEEIETLKHNCLYLQEQINQADKAVKENEILLQEEKNQNRNLKQQCQEIEQRYTVQITNLESACNEREKEIRIQEKDIEDKRETMIQAEARLKHLSDTIAAKDLEIDDLEAKTSELECLKTRLEFDINTQKTKSTALEQTVKELEISVAMHKDIESKLKQIAEIERHEAKELKEKVQILEGYVDQAEKDRTEMKDLKEMIRELEMSKEELQFQASFTVSQMEDLTSKLQKQRDEYQNVSEQLAETTNELQQWQVKHTNIEKELGNAEKTITEQCKQLDMKDNMLEDLQSKIDEISLERANNKGVLEEVMDSRDKKIAGYEKKIKTLEEKVSSKTKQISKLQLDIKNLKGQLKKGERLNVKQENEIALAKEQLEKLEKEKSNRFEELQTREATLLDELHTAHMLSNQKEKEAEAMILEMEKLKNQAEMSLQEYEKAQEDLRATKQGFDSQITEMCNTLEKYKVENEKLMNAKEKELDMRTNEILASNKKLHETVKEKDCEIERLTEQCHESDLKVKQLEQQIHEMNTKVSNLEASNLEAQTDKNERSDVEMIEFEEKHRNATETYEKREEKFNLDRRSPIMSNSYMTRLNNTPQTATPISNPNGKYTKICLYNLKKLVTKK